MTVVHALAIVLIALTIRAVMNERAWRKSGR